MSAESRWRQLAPRRFFLETWQQMDAEAAALRQAQPNRRYDLRPLVVLCSGAAFLTCQEYFGGSAVFRQLLAYLAPADVPPEMQGVWHRLARSPFGPLLPYVWWSGFRFFSYVVGPVLVLRLLGERVRDHGLQTRGFRQHLWLYLLCYAVVAVCVVAVSFSPSFARYYPFYDEASRSWADLVAWELLYALQFFSLEFFFRGFWLHACKASMGSQAIFAMTVPYCMIHYGKPWSEALAAIVAGVVLGTLAMKTRSIWSGALIHVSVALTMDLAALMQTHRLPSVWWPG